MAKVCLCFYGQINTISHFSHSLIYTVLHLLERNTEFTFAQLSISVGEKNDLLQQHDNPLE